MWRGLRGWPGNIFGCGDGDAAAAEPRGCCSHPWGGGPALGRDSCHCREMGDPLRPISPVGKIPGSSLGNTSGMCVCGPAGVEVEAGRVRLWVQAGTSPRETEPALCAWGPSPGLGEAAPLLPGAAGTDPPGRGCGEGAGSCGGSEPPEVARPVSPGPQGPNAAEQRGLRASRPPISL